MICHNNAQTHCLPCFNVEQDPTRSGWEPCNSYGVCIPKIKSKTWLLLWFPLMYSVLDFAEEWWNSKDFHKIPDNRIGQMNWVKQNFMVYDYCTDTERYPMGLPFECTFDAHQQWSIHRRRPPKDSLIYLLELTPFNLTTLWLSSRTNSCDSSCHSFCGWRCCVLSIFEETAHLKTMIMSCCSNLLNLVISYSSE